MSVLNVLTLDPSGYQTAFPYSYGIQDNILNHEFATALQNEILQIPANQWDRYKTPFEANYTLRDKYNLPPLLKQLFTELISPTFVSQLARIVDQKLILDLTRNFWGVHVYDSEDTTEIHVDKTFHPVLSFTKEVTLQIFLSANWKEDYGGQIEIWQGESAKKNDAKLIQKVDSIAPIFNQMIVFRSNDCSWHGNPEPACCPVDSRRIFITISYLSEDFSDENKRVNAFFIARPEDPVSAERD